MVTVYPHSIKQGDVMIGPASGQRLTVTSARRLPGKSTDSRFEINYTDEAGKAHSITVRGTQELPVEEKLV